MKKAQTNYPINELIANRWSPRAFSEKEIEDEQLMILFEAARWAPSSMNEQPWGFIAVKKQNREVFDLLVETLNEGNRKWAKNATVLTIVTARRQFAKEGWVNKTAGYDTGQAVANLSIQATELGIFIHQLGGFDKDQVRKIFKINENKDIIVVMAMGYLGDADMLDDKNRLRESKPRARKHFDEFAHILK